MSSEIINCAKNIFAQLTLGDVEKSTISQVTYLMDTISNTKDKEIYFNPYISGIIFLLKELKISNVLLDISIKQYKTNLIKILIDGFDDDCNSDDRSCENSPDDNSDSCTTLQKISEKHKHLFPEPGQQARVREYVNEDSNEYVEYIIDSEGTILASEFSGDKLDLKDIDFNEIYSVDKDDALEYNDILQPESYDKLVSEEDLIEGLASEEILDKNVE